MTRALRGITFGGAVAVCVLSLAAPARVGAAPAPPRPGAAAPHGTPSDPLSYLQPAARARFASLRQQVGAVRAAMATRRISDAMLATAAAGGHPFTTIPALPQPSAADERRVTALPASLRDPVAALLAATEAARSMLGNLPADEVRREIGEMLAGLGTVAQRTAAAPGAVTLRNPVNGVTRTQRPPVPMLGATALGPATRHAVENGAAAALLVAEAVDAALPALRQAAAGMPRSAAPAPGCDMLDQSPLLCVGGAADNTYSQPEALLVDLGGDNTFTGLEGAAPFPDPASPDSYEPLSVAVVAGSGNNSYTSTVLPLVGGSAPAGVYGSVSVGQGAGIVGGVGVLVDASSGHHTYTATAPPSPGARDNGYPIPQATVAEGSGALGQGVLVDEGSASTFTATGPTSGSMTSGVFAQGDGQYDPSDGCQPLQGYCSYGLLLATGQGTDTYSIDGGAILPPGGISLVGAAGQGAGTGMLGSGFLLDDGGADSFAVTEAAASGVHDRANHLLENPATELNAQGYGDIGAGMLIEGGGSHTYSIDVEQRGTAVSTWGVSGQGAANLLGLGVLSDAGSGNTYAMRHASSDVSTFERASQTVNAYDAAGLDNTVDLVGQGSTWSGTAMLDNAGAATYTAVAQEDIHDALGVTGRLDVTGFTPPRALVQGSAEPNLESTTAALLLNEGGHADYSAEATDTVEASGPPGSQVLATVPLQFDYAAMQGASAWNGLGLPGMAQGALLDMGGPGDTFHAVQRHGATTTPDSGGGVAAGGFWDPMQGNGDGALLVAAGASPSLTASPANGVCPGSPGAAGSAAWTTCGMYGPASEDADHTDYDYLSGDNQGYGGGLVPSSAATAPSLTLDPVPASATDGTPLLATVHLHDASGAPVRGATVHLDAQLVIATDPAKLTAQWLNISQADGVTDATGTATVPLPLGYNRLLGITSLAQAWSTQVLATYDGSSTLTPVHAARGFALAFGPAASVPELPLVPLAPLAAAPALLAWRRRARKIARERGVSN